MTGLQKKKKPDYFLLTTKKDNLDDFSKKCTEEQQAFEKREDANLLYVALTRAKQMLFISGSEPKGKSHGWYEKICSAFGYKSTENTEIVTLETYKEVEHITKSKKPPGKTKIIIDSDLSSVIKIQRKDIDISPSAQNIFNTAHTEFQKSTNTIRGTVMHQMLNQLSRHSQTELSQFYSPEMNEVNKNELEEWWQECQATINNDAFTQYFDASHYDKFYNEVPLQFKEDDKHVYGIIDRLIIKDKNVTVIDYKTHPYVNDKNMQSVAETYREQMQLYKSGVQLLWPEYNVTAKLLFTANASEYSY